MMYESSILFFLSIAFLASACSLPAYSRSSTALSLYSSRTYDVDAGDLSGMQKRITNIVDDDQVCIEQSCKPVYLVLRAFSTKERETRRMPDGGSYGKASAIGVIPRHDRR
jgi:hypothetical protein